MKILIVEDEETIVEALRPALSSQGHEVHAVGDGKSALTWSQDNTVDLVLLDLGLPDVDGIELIRRIKELTNAAVIVLSARHQEQDKVRALDEGADDYVNKPFGIEELLARLRTVERRRHAGPQNEAETFQSRELTISFLTREVRLLGEVVKLSPKEYALLETLAKNSGQVVTQRRLLIAGWNDPTADSQYLRTYVGLLRQKIEYDPSEPRLILTEPGVGYRLLVTDC